jgi:biotin carboxylase
MSKIIVITDPYSSGALLAPIFRTEGYDCIAVHSSLIIPKIFRNSYRKEHFSKEIFFSDTEKDSIIDNLNQHNCAAVIPGAESGVELADILANELGLIHNNLNLSSCRRDKYLMQKRLKDVGLKYINSLIVENIDEIEKIIQYLKFPIIVKPINSAGSDNIFKCNSINEVTEGCNAILNKHNALGLYNSKALLQEYIDGQEYVIDTISCNGKHHTTNACLYKKISINGSDVVYKQMDFISPDSNDLTQLIEYNNKVLDALDIMYGPAHSEIMLTPDGPVLIEVGARVHGGGTPKTVSKISHLSQLNLILPSYLDEDFFCKKIEKENTSFHKNACVYFFINSKEGILKKIDYIEEIKALNSFFDLVLTVQIDSLIQKTVSLNNSPGWVVLINQNDNVLKADLEKLERLHSQGIFIIE